MIQLPTLFISHGPPWTALMPWPARHFLQDLGDTLTRPRAILMISAHWESVDPLVTIGPRPEILYDFGGVSEMRNLEYELPGEPDLAENVLHLLNQGGFPAEGVSRGFDHGTWTPLMLMYPRGDIPVVQLSIQTERSAPHHHRVGACLAELRQAGVLIMASGGAVHNLQETVYEPDNIKPADFVCRFDCWLEDQIVNCRTDKLLDFQHQAPDTQRCHPYPAEHFLPLFVALGAAGDSPGRKIHHSFQYRALSMAAYLWE